MKPPRRHNEGHRYAPPAETWRERALCAHPSVRPQDFSPVDARGRLDHDKARSIAAALCAPCPVRDACRADALTRRGSGPGPAGLGPQELICAGIWFPPENARDTTPIDLLATPADTPTHEEAAAA